MKITKDMLISEAVAVHPDVARKLFDAGLHCIGCMMASMETLEQGLAAHGKSEEEINDIIDEINYLLNNEKNK